MTDLQEKYWRSQMLYDKLFSLEHHMRKLALQGKTPQKTLAKYWTLIDELREINAEMIMMEGEAVT